MLFSFFVLIGIQLITSFIYFGRNYYVDLIDIKKQMDKTPFIFIELDFPTKLCILIGVP